LSVKTTLYKQFDSIEIKESLFKTFSLPEHFHDTYCIGLLCSGIKASSIEGTPQLIHSNSISIINPYQIHSDKNIDNDDCLYRMIYINKEALNFFAHKINGKKDNDLLFTNDLITDLRVSSAILSLFNAIEDEKILEHKLKTLIGLLITKDFTKNQIIVNNESLNAINDSIAYARLNFSEKIDIGKMSNESKLSKYQFIRYFKKMTGITPASYILVHRINFAKS
jgi:AraC-like DNA-binding protein